MMQGFSDFGAYSPLSHIVKGSKGSCYRKTINQAIAFNGDSNPSVLACCKQVMVGVGT
jgi:hypothetical protein